MITNNLFLVLFHILYIFVLIPFMIDYNFSASMSVIIYLLFQIPYLLFGLFLEPFLNYHKSKFKNMLSFSTLFFVGVFFAYLEYSSNSYGPMLFFAMFIAPSAPIAALFGEFVSSSKETLLWPLFSIPYMILAWLGMELRRKIRKRVI
ncbi:hypothetical protein [Lutispora sp.]|uniref:hypothetical protein n=1 Tax=Lutispora sp. TaxID=2828727 RepID=UPI003565E38F